MNTQNLKTFLVTLTQGIKIRQASVEARDVYEAQQIANRVAQSDLTLKAEQGYKVDVRFLG